MKKLSDVNSKMTDKIQKFFNTNNWIIALGIIFVFVYFSLKIGDVADSVQKSETAVRKDIGKVIFISSDGQIVKLKKNTVSYKDGRIANYISDILENGLITDLVRISKGFKQTYQNGFEVISEYPSFKNFSKYLINNGWLVNYANNILMLVNEDNYPEYVQVYDKKINYYKVEGNNFSISVDYYVIKRCYLKEVMSADKYVTSKNVVHIWAKGFFDIAKYGSFDDPFGIKFTDIKINILTKR